MQRRDLLRLTALLPALARAQDRPFQSGFAGPGKVYYEVHGPRDGKALILGFPLMASYAEIFGKEQAGVKSAFLDRFTDRYRVILVDYPGIGKSGDLPPGEMTADRVCRDMLAVATAAGCDRFAWFGSLWGAVIGLLLASRTTRVSALVCGCWPPLGAPYAYMLRGTLMNLNDPPPHARVILREPAQYRRWATFYESMKNFPETKAVASIRCPRLVVYGEKAESGVAGIRLPWAEILRARRQELEALGWRVHEIAGRDTGVILDAAAMAPVIRSFLDSR